MSKLAAFLCLAILISSFARAAPLPDPGFKTLRTWDEFTDLIRKNDVRSIDQLLPLLPTDFLKGYALIYRSRALHRELVSERRPRVLVYGTDGKFILTFNSHASGGAAKPGDQESIETIEFTPEGAKLRVVDFDGVHFPLDRPIETNPLKCAKCHGTDPKGLWDPYNHWAGVYGSLSRAYVDFIRVPTPERPIPEYDAFMSFLEERKTNPRYALLDLDVTTLSKLSEEMDRRRTPLLAPFNPDKMMDAVVFKAGHEYGTNQLLGMLIGQENFARIGRSMLKLPPEKRTAFQYLFKGISLDEQYTVLRKDKKFSCLPRIDSFFPAEFYQHGFSNYRTFREFILANQENDYNHAKSEVESRNLGLSKKGAGFSSEDPFDQDPAGRDLLYDSIAADLNIENLFGMTGSSGIMYAFYSMGLPFDQFSTSSNGNRYSLYYGNSAECLRGTALDRSCTKEDAETFVTRFVPRSFFADPGIDGLNCDELAAKSREAIKNYLRGARVAPPQKLVVAGPKP